MHRVTNLRGTMMAAVFSFQRLGQFVSALVSFLLTIGFRNSLQSSGSCGDGCISALDKSWRVLYGLGIFPAFVALYFRLTIPETIPFTLDVRGDENRALADANWFIEGRLGPAQHRPGDPQFLPAGLPIQTSIRNLKREIRDFFRHFSQWEKGRELLGTAGSWFFLDVAFVWILRFLNSILVRNNFEYTTYSSSDWLC